MASGQSSDDADDTLMDYTDHECGHGECCGAPLSVVPRANRKASNNSSKNKKKVRVFKGRSNKLNRRGAPLSVVPRAKQKASNNSSKNKKKVRVFEERSNKLNWRVYRILTHTLF